jgi:NAD(P)-dependent dehydrogenase (short-subunit alcohol dehydrogenase family)
MSKLANETALVTGASRGMGGAAALVLAAAGAFTATAWPELTQADGAGLSRAPGPCPWMSITVSAGEVVAQDVGDKRRESYGDSSSIGGATRIDPRTTAPAPMSAAVFMTSK